ncbi:MAG: ribosome biogenesis GTPase Der [Nitrospirae bacterium]|nr:MAG: ribosome biogenesis GTPase Der [Nitrospirota bacterium]
MALPMIAIVGRPNVGKSTLFNRLLGRRHAIVEDTPGVTRDRIVARGEIGGRPVLLADTGGLGAPGDPLAEAIARQAEAAIEAARVVVHLVDARAGLQPGDEQIAGRLRRAGVPVVTVANKADGVDPVQIAADFAPLGVAEVLPLSARHGINTRKLAERLAALLPPAEAGRPPDLSLAVVGRPNAGKSTLVNALAGEERVVVSDLPGTTRDAVDTEFAWRHRRIRIIDTAGLRRRRATREGLERYSVLRALGAVQEAEVTVLLVDATVGCRDQEQKIAGYLAEHHRACVVAVNKWDRIEKGRETHAQWLEELRHCLPFLAHAPVVTCSAARRQRLHRLLELCFAVAEEYRTRLPTAQVNRVVEEAVAAQPPPRVRGRRPRIYYASQAEVAPPTVVLFTARPEEIPASYRRYLVRRLRQGLGLAHTPIRLVVRRRR